MVESPKFEDFEVDGRQFSITIRKPWNEILSYCMSVAYDVFLDNKPLAIECSMPGPWNPQALKEYVEDVYRQNGLAGVAALTNAFFELHNSRPAYSKGNPIWVETPKLPGYIKDMKFDPPVFKTVIGSEDKDSALARFRSYMLDLHQNADPVSV